MAKAYAIKRGAKTPQEKQTTSGMNAPKKLMLLFTIVNRSKAEFYTDVLQKSQPTVRRTPTCRVFSA